MMHNALEYVQNKLSLAEQLDFFEHVRHCHDCQQDLILYLQLKQATTPVLSAPTVTLPKHPSPVKKAFDQVQAAVELCFKFIPIGD